MPARVITVAGVGLTGLGIYYYKKNQAALPTVKPSPQNVQFADPRPFELLTRGEIDRRLRSGQLVTRTQLSNVKAIYTNQLASNNPVEDNYSVNVFDNDKLIAGVYDGHIGPCCSRLIKRQLPIYVARQLGLQQPKEEASVQDAISTAFTDLDQDIQQRFYDLFPRNVKHLTEQDVREAIARHPDPATADMHIKTAIHGSCACVVYLDKDDLYAANTGDSRVVVVRQEEDGTWTGRRLVEEQSPAHPAWRAHMISQHPSTEADAIVKRNRIFGLIAVGGSFGDIMYKVPKEYQLKVLPFIPYETYNSFAHYHHRIIAHYRTPPYLSSKPLMSHHKLQKGDKYIVIGTDGLWDELSWDNVRSEDGDQMAAELISRWPAKHEKNPATHLVREALLYDAVYKNVGRRVPVSDETLELSKRLTRQPSRRYRDDITVTVIELNMEHDTSPVPLTEVGPVTEAEDVPVKEPRLAEPKKPSSWYSGWFSSRL